MSKTTPLRSEVPSKFTWATEDLYINDEAFLTDLDIFKDKINELSQYRGVIASDSRKLYEYFSLKNELIPLGDKLIHYAMLKNDEDTTNSTYQNYKSKINDAYVLMQGLTAFEVPNLMTINDDTLESFYKETPELEFFRKAIEENLRLADHTLDEEGERLLAMVGEMADSSHNTFTLMSNADMNFESITVDGTTHSITQASLIPLMQNRDRRVRKATFETYYKAYRTFKNTFASTLQGHMKMLSFYANAQKYNSTLESSLMENNVNCEVYHNLISTVRNNLQHMHDYVRLRKKALSLDEIHMYDIYAPLIADYDQKIPYEEAVNNLIDAMSVYGEEYVSILKEGFSNRWIDVYENIGKRSGAYSAGSYVHPYILLNYNDNLDSEFTLAHEMGHALHSYFSNRTQAPIYSQYVIFVAEVASTCNEALLMQYLLKKTTDPKERATLINYFLEQFKGTLYRQTMFAEFELKMNELVAEGEALTAELLCEEYLKLNRDYFGPDMVMDEEIALEWARIPHFYYNYYVYQYATGFSAAIALSTKILEEGQPAVDAYLNFLRSGCTKDPVSLLRDAGVDMASPKPVETALELFSSLIKEMEELL